MNFDQGEFSFDSKDSEAGYRNWQKRLEEQRLAFERRWGIPLNQRVRLQLKDHVKPIVGKIEVSDLRAKVPRLKIGTLDFPADQIESAVRED